MPDEQPQVTETPAETPAANPPPPQTAPATEPPKDNGSETAPVDTPQAQPEAEQKPNRAQRRIEQLIGKTKQREQLDEQERLSNQGLPWQPLTLKGKEEITAEDLEAFVEKKAQAIVAQREYENRVQAKVHEWQDDLGTTLKEHPELDPNSKQYDAELDSFLQDTLEKAGVVTPDGKLQNPDFKVSTIMNRMKGLFEKVRTQGAAETTASMAKTIAEGALTPGGETDNSPSLNEMRSNLWANAQKVRQELEGKLPVADD